MRSISDQFMSMLPGAFALLLLALFSAPAQFSGFSWVPNVAWVMTLIVAFLYPPAWSRGFAFLLGLLQDVIFGTPLGSQALLSLLLVQLVEMQMRRSSYQRFRIRWLEAAGVLIVWHFLLWLICHFVNGSAAPLRMMLGAGVASTLWYPFFYFPLSRLVMLLPPVK